MNDIDTICDDGDNIDNNNKNDGCDKPQRVATFNMTFKEQSSPAPPLQQLILKHGNADSDSINNNKNNTMLEDWVHFDHEYKNDAGDDDDDDDGAVFPFYANGIAGISFLASASWGHEDDDNDDRNKYDYDLDSNTGSVVVVADDAGDHEDGVEVVTPRRIRCCADGQKMRVTSTGTVATAPLSTTMLTTTTTASQDEDDDVAVDKQAQLEGNGDNVWHIFDLQDYYDHDNYYDHEDEITSPPNKAFTQCQLKQRYSMRSRKLLPVYHQYIVDRVSGNSYIPREYRPGGRLYQQIGKDNDAFVYRDEDGNDPTDCQNRPPHYLCYLPVCVRRWPRVLEQNSVCEWVGKWGFHAFFKHHHVVRRRIFLVGFCFNFCALLLTITASLAYAVDHTLLSHFSFSRGYAMIPAWSNTTALWTADLGFRAIAYTPGSAAMTNTEYHEQQPDVLLWDSVCQDSSPQAVAASNGVCGDCRDSAESFVLSLLINMILIVRNMFSDVTRMYPRYDSNCPNFSGSLLATISVFLGLWTIFSYQQRCFHSVTSKIDDDSTWLSSWLANETSLLSSSFSNEVPLAVRMEWGAGPGLICLVTATFLKIIDAVCNYIVPTPPITRHVLYQERYELEFGGGSGSNSSEEQSKVGVDEEIGKSMPPPKKKQENVGSGPGKQKRQGNPTQREGTHETCSSSLP